MHWEGSYRSTMSTMQKTHSSPKTRFCQVPIQHPCYLPFTVVYQALPLTFSKTNLFHNVSFNFGWVASLFQSPKKARIKQFSEYNHLMLASHYIWFLRARENNHILIIICLFVKIRDLAATEDPAVFFCSLELTVASSNSTNNCASYQVQSL